MNITDYIPHGITVAFAGVISYIFRNHVEQDDARFKEIKEGFTEITNRQTVIADKMAENHSEILKVLLEAEQQRTSNELNAERRA